MLECAIVVGPMIAVVAVLTLVLLSVGCGPSSSVPHPREKGNLKVKGPLTGSTGEK